MTDDLYKDLGVEKDATTDAIKQAHKAFAKKNHPDKPGGSNDKMAEGNRAYEILVNPEKRKRYDETGETKEDSFEKQLSAFINETLIIIIEKVGDIETIDLVEEFKRIIIHIEEEAKKKKIEVISSIVKYKEADLISKNVEGKYSYYRGKLPLIQTYRLFLSLSGTKRS